MVEINSKSFQQLVSDQAAATQAEAKRTLDYGRGSILLMLARSFASIGLWMQAQIFKVLSATRLTTSVKEDVDSFVEDFGMPRIREVFATGEVRFGRYSIGYTAFIPVKAMVRTGDAQLTFLVAANDTHPMWDGDRQGYVLPSAVMSTLLPVIASTAGPGSNVDPGTISLLSSPIVGIDYVINETSMSGGVEAERDDQVKKRFPLYIGSLSKGTDEAIGYAVSQVKSGLAFTAIEGSDAEPYGVDFVVVINDGSGAPNASLISQVSDAVSQTRALGVSWAVIWSSTRLANVSMAISTEYTRDKPAAVAAVQTALKEYIDGLGMGERLPYTRLAEIAYRASSKVTNVTGVVLNGGTSDLIPTKVEVIDPGSISVS